MNFAVRDALPGDQPYIAATARHQVARFIRHVHPTDIEHVTLAILSVSRIAVACSADEPTAILGWAASVAGVTWFVFVPRDLRRCGIARQIRKYLQNGNDDNPPGLRHPHRRRDDLAADAIESQSDDGPRRTGHRR